MFINDKIEQLYDYVKNLAAHKRAEPGLAALSFLEGFIFPLPPDLMLIPMVMARRERAWRYAFIAAFFSVLGGIVGYGIGMWAWDALAYPVLESLGKTKKVASLQAKYDEYGAIGVFFAGLTPFPYIVITIMSGAMKLNFWLFVGIAAFARFLRFFLVAGIVYIAGPRAEEIMRKNFALATLVIFALLMALYSVWHFGISPRI